MDESSKRVATRYSGPLRKVMLLAPLISVAVGAWMLVSTFAPGTILHALQHANIDLIVLAFLVGAVIEVLEAERATIMLVQCRPIRWRETFSIQVVSNAFGHAVPFAPASMGVRCLLTRKVRNIPMFFSAGVFLAVSVLDSAALLPLLTYLLLLVSLPAWQRLLLTGMLVQTVICLGAPLLSGTLASSLVRLAVRHRAPKPFLRLARAARYTAMGLSTVVSGGRKMTAALIGITLVNALLGMFRLELLLRAFALHVSFTQLCVLMIMSSLVGNLPVPIPGAGTWATAKALKSVGIVSSGAGGYILVLRTISAIETPILALLVLLWWSVGRSPDMLSLKDLRAAQKMLSTATAPSPTELPG